MWSSLPSNLRAVLGTALALGVGVAVAAFTLSFFALRSAAENPKLEFGHGHAWLFPLGIDLALVFFEVLLLGASMVRIQERGRVVQYNRAIPFLLLMAAAAATVYFNVMRVPAEVRPVALAVPVASILVTLGLAYLLKMLAAASGGEVIHLAPPTLQPGLPAAVPGTVRGELYRDGGGEGSMESPRWAYTELGQTGHGGGEASKRELVESYLARVDPDGHQRRTGALTAREVAAGLFAEGTPVSERYVHDLFGGRSGPLRNGSRP